MKKKWYWAGAAMLLFLILYVLSDLLQSASHEMRLPLTMAETMIVLGVLAMIRWATEQKWKPEHVFSILFIPLSLLMMICMPVTRVPDEIGHLQKVWQISVGDWVPNEENRGIFSQPQNMWEGIEREADTTLVSLIKIADSQMDMEHLIQLDASPATGFYPVHNYFAQALGMTIVRCFTLNRLAIFYGARFGGWLATFFLLFFAVKRIPVGKYVLMALSLSPMVLQEAISASADGITFAIVAAFFAQTLYLHSRKELLRPAEYISLYALTFCASTFKVFYCPFSLLLFVMDEKCFGGKKERMRGALLILAATLLPILGWALFCKETYIVAGAEGEIGVSVIVPQIKYILMHPVAYMLTLLRTLLNNCVDYVQSMMGSSLSLFNIGIPAVCNAGLIIQFALVSARDTGLDFAETSIANAISRMTWAAILLSIAFVCTGLYIWWTPYANAQIYGIQGRYFLPIAMPAVLMIKKKKTDGSLYTPLCAMFALDVLVIGRVLVCTIGC